MGAGSVRDSSTLPETVSVSKPAFGTAPEIVPLESKQIHVWCATLSDFDSKLSHFHALLSGAERRRAERFRSSKDCDFYVLRRGILREILGRYLEQHPSEIGFSYGRFGKPEIKGDRVRGPLHFNVSHSGDLALYAVTPACPIGVDVEHLRPVLHFEEIASQFFSPREAEILMALPIDFRMDGFFACWTRKEAYLKATGEGIGEGLAKVEVTLPPGEEGFPLTGKSETRTEWQLRSFSAAPGYLAAVAFRHHNLELGWWRVGGI